MAPTKKNKGELWGWHDFRTDEYCFIYPKRFQVEMCSPDGFKKKTEDGRGKIVKLKAIEVEDDTNK